MAEQKEILESIRDALSGKDDILDLTQKVNDDGSITELTPKFKEAAPLKIEPVMNVKPQPEPVATKAPVAMPETLAEGSDDILSEIDSILNNKAMDEKVELEFAERVEPQKFAIEEEFEAADVVEPTAAPEPEPAAANFDGHILPREENEKGKNMDDNITADDAKDSISELLNKVHKQNRPTTNPTPAAPFRSGTTMEDLVAEMLKPLMQDWLDKNLPKLVKETVQKEIQKLIPRE